MHSCLFNSSFAAVIFSSDEFDVLIFEAFTNNGWYLGSVSCQFGEGRLMVSKSILRILQESVGAQTFGHF